MAPFGRKFLGKHQLVAVIRHTRPAVLFGHCKAQQPGLPGGSPDSTRHHVLTLPLRVVGGHFVSNKLACRLTEKLVVFGEFDRGSHGVLGC